jgi:mycothiol synthase
MNARPATEADFDRVLAMLAADEELIWRRPSRLTLADLRQWLSGVDLDRNTWLYEEDGKLVAFGWLDKESDELAFAVGIVAPGFKGRGLGGELVECAERRAKEEGAARIHQVTFAVDDGATAVMKRHGYREVRRFWEMAIHLEDEPAVPADVPIDPFDEADARAFHAALDDSFRDHWEHSPSTFDDWWERVQRSGNYDPTLWFVVRDGDDIAAAVRNDANRNGGGYVGAIGVRRPWRGRGYGRALLLRTFAEFHRRGQPRVTLGVDAANPTGATRLYESVGMAPEQEQVVHEKSLA